jgi:hypothetical protein
VINAAPLLSEALHQKFIAPLARRFATSDGDVRAALITAQVLGFATLRFALGSEILERQPQGARRLLATALQTSIDGPGSVGS